MSNSMPANLAGKQASLSNGDTALIERAPPRGYGRDAEGWLIPPLSAIPPVPDQSIAERTRQNRLVTALERCRWQTVIQPACYGRDGEVRRPDVVAWHPDIPGLVGAVEIKGAIADDRQAADALKQGYDYTQCKVLATAQRIGWAGVYPFQPPPDPIAAARMWGAAKLAALNLKTLTFIDDESGGPVLALPGFEDCGRILLLYTSENRCWCTDRGFVANAAEMLGGRRQVGGQRK